MHIIQTSDLSVRRSRSFTLSGINLNLDRGEWLGLVGPNGSGKSSLLSAIGGLLPYGGKAILLGREVGKLKPAERGRLVSLVRQSAPLTFDMTVSDLALLGRSPYKKFFQGFDHTDQSIAMEALSAVDLGAFVQRSVLSLSGGERQRAFLAQAFVQDTSLLLLDEPTNHLDMFHQFDFLNRISERQNSGTAVIAAFHDLSLAARYASKILVVNEGRQIAFGRTDEILTESLIRNVFRMNCRVRKVGSRLEIEYIGPVEPV